MPFVGNNNTNLNVTVTTSADTSGMDKASDSVKQFGTKVQDLAAKLDVAKAKVDEAFYNPNNTKSQWLKLTNDVTGYQNKLDDAIAKEQGERSSQASLAGSVALGEAAYNAAAAAIQKVSSYLQDSVAQATLYQSAMIGLSSVTVAFGGNSDAATDAAKSLATDGLMTVTDAATGLKNLLASGFSLPQAIQLMNSFKDSASFNRQAALSFGQAIDSATQGIKNGNSIMTDNAGITKNLSQILVEHGKTQQDVMNITSDASVRQALYNGLLQEASAFTGDAARYSDTFAGAQARAGAEAIKLSQNVGEIVQMFEGPLISGFSDMLHNNQQMIVSFGFSAVAAVAVSAGLFGVVKAIQAFSLESILAVASNPLLLALTAIGVVAGVVVYNAMGKLEAQVKKNNDSLSDVSRTASGAVPDGLNKAGKAAQDLADKLGNIDDQIKKANRDFQEQLAGMVQSHEDKVKSIQDQLNTENQSFTDSSDKNADSFTKSQKTQIDQHQKKVQSIEQQIANLQGINKDANKVELQNLQDQLAEENRQYAEQAAIAQTTQDEQNAKLKADHDKKVNDLQAQLDAENALLNKHAADVASIRNTTMLDEIDKLKRSHDEQIAAFEDQKNQAIKKSGEATAGVESNWDTMANNMKKNTGPMTSAGGALGDAMGNAMKDALKEALKDTGKGIVNWLGTAVAAIPKMFDSKEVVKDKNGNFDASASWNKIWNDAQADPAWSHRATGGPVQAGMPYLVGDNPDGSINDTTELFVPGQSGTILPASQTKKMMGGVSMYNTFNVYNQTDISKIPAMIGFKLAAA